MTEFEPDLIFTKAVGVTFEGRQQVIQAIERLLLTNKDSVKIFLQPEPTNQFDPNAVAITATYYDNIFLSEVTRQVGYVRKELAAQISEELKQGYSFDIIEFEATGGYDKQRGVNIKILRKEANMPTVTAMDLLNQKSSRGQTDYLRLDENKTLMVRFLKPLSEAWIEATHSIKVNGKYERFAALQYINGVFDDTVSDPAVEAGFKPWIKLVLPVIDRADGKVKLFSETVAVYRNLKIFEEQPANDAEKSVKLGSITRADITIMQMGKGRDRKINAFPVGTSIRDLTAEEKALKVPDPKAGQKIITVAEINDIIKRFSAENSNAVNAAAMNVGKGPFSS